KNYPKDKRGEVEVVDFCDFKVEGHLDLSDFVNLKELNLRYSRITKLDLSHNSKLTQLEYDYHLAPNLKGLKNTSIIWLDAQYYSQEFSDSQEIWQILVNVRKECFPEMKLIDFSDLNQLAVKTNKETVNQRNFSSEVFPSPPNPKELHGLKCFCCNRTIPKTSAGATYVPKHQELVNKVLSGDKELIELKTEKETSEELRKQTEKEKTDHQQTKPNHQSQLKDLTTILFPSNSCNSFANFAFADLKKQASQIIQENQEAQVKISELESQISNLNQQLYSIQQQTALSQGENLKTAMEKEKKINNLVEGGY
ncbi:31984_t:CDS:2, partial [Racocetra persica]